MVNAILGMGNDMPQRLNAIEARLRDLSTQPILLHASTGQDGGQGLSTDKNGLHLFNPAGVEVATLSTIDGSATLGNTTITGNLSVPNGSITNSALQNPPAATNGHADASNFAVIAGPQVEVVRVTFTVPAGYSQAVVTAVGNVTATNSTGATDWLYGGISINGYSPGWASQTSVPPGGNGNVSRGETALLTGLATGSTFWVHMSVASSNANWAASTNNSNSANIDASVIWLR